MPLQWHNKIFFKWPVHSPQQTTPFIVVLYFSKGGALSHISGEECQLDDKARKELLINSENVRTEFHRLIKKVIEDIQGKEVAYTTRQLSDCVLLFIQSKSWKMPKNLESDMQSRDSIEGIFNVLFQKRLIKYYDIELLEEIVTVSLKEDTTELKEYKNTLQKYFKLRICELDVYESGKFVCADLSLVSEKLVLIADSTWAEDFIAQELFILECKLEQILGCPLRLVKICPGSLVIYFNAPLVELQSLSFEDVLQLIHLGVAELQDQKSGDERSMEKDCKFLGESAWGLSYEMAKVDFYTAIQL